MPRKCLVINIDRCTGCDSCIVSCKFENHLPLGTFYNRVMQVGPTGTYPNIERYNLPVQCQQCTHARCVEVCPTGASYRDSESGIVLVNEAKCIGCQYCLYACPYGVRSFSEEDGVARKCTLCQHLTADGKADPVCVHNCPGGARFYGDLDDPDSAVSRELAKYDDECIHTLGAPEGEEPLTRYILSPSMAHWKELV
ncbi:4Fe-4S dicluster domain-containing protein [Adlercreutzia sp.]|uniref:4Fe-4S dicluster domain-containing protein n=1 Tax=Adlercreutzia sp. TaxID=1872387 RepID=UPI003A8B2549